MTRRGRRNRASNSASDVSSQTSSGRGPRWSIRKYLVVFIPLITAAGFVITWVPKLIEFWSKSSAPIAELAQVIYFKAPDYVGLSFLNNRRATNIAREKLEKSAICAVKHEWTNLSGDGRWMDLFVTYYDAPEESAQEKPCDDFVGPTRAAVFRQKGWSFVYAGGGGEEAGGGNSFSVKGQFVLEDIGSGGEIFLNVLGLTKKGLEPLAVFNGHEAGYQAALQGDDLLVGIDEGFFRVSPGVVGRVQVSAKEIAPSDRQSRIFDLVRSADGYRLSFDDTDLPLTSQGDNRSRTERVFVRRSDRLYVAASCEGRGYRLSKEFFGAWIFDPEEPAQNPRSLVCWISEGEHLPSTPDVEIVLQVER